MKISFFTLIIIGGLLHYSSSAQNINKQESDPIAPVINSYGDTIKTGVSIPIRGRLIHPSSVEKPAVIRAGMPKKVETGLSLQASPENLTRTRVDKKSQIKILVGSSASTFVLRNSIGDSIPSGVALPVEGKQVLSRLPTPVPASTPRMKDHATADIRFLDVEQGMNSSYARSLIEDTQGRLWIGTYRGGVTQYDGREFRHFTLENGLSHNVVLALLKDRSGNIWMGTGGGGVCRYDGESFTQFTEREGLSDNTVLSIWEDKKGHLWFGTLSSGVTRYDGQTLTHFTEKEGLSSNAIWSISEDDQGNLWFSTWGGGVCQFDGKRFIHFTQRDGLSSDFVWCTYHDSKGDLWIGSDNGLNHYDGTYVTQFGVKDGLPNAKIRTLHESGDGSLWIGTEGGAVKYNGKAFTQLTEREGMSSNHIRTIYEDEEGNLWFATEGGGINYYRINSFSHLTEREGLSHNRIRAIVEDDQHNMWLGSDGYGISYFDGQSLLHYTEKEGLSKNTVWSMHQDRNGNLWIGTDLGGVNRFDGQTFIHYTVKEGLSGNIVRDILEDQRGNIWFATWGGGVCYFTPSGKTGLGSFTHFTESEGLANNIVRSIYEDNDGNIWCGTNGGGVSRLNYDTLSEKNDRIRWNTVTHFSTKEGLSDNHVTTIIGDTKDHLWIGTNGNGLNRLDPRARDGKGLFTQYTEHEGLSNNIIWSTLLDHHGNLWVGTEKGMNYLTFTHQLDDVGVPGINITMYGYADGLKAIDFNHNSSLIDHKNHAWWGTGKSLVTLNLDHQAPKTDLPTAKLTRLEIAGAHIDFGNLPSQFSERIDLDGVRTHDQLPLRLTLDYDLNHITFHFVAKGWSARDKIQYSYRLKALSEDWSVPIDNGKVEFRNLPFGSHTFEVRALGVSQSWGPIESYDFIIRAPWWWSRTAILFYALASLVLIFFVDRIQRQRVIKKEREKAREIQLAQAKEVEEAYHKLKATQAQLIHAEKMASLGELTAGIAHEIQNPLNFVNNFSDVSGELIDEAVQELDNDDPIEAKEILFDLKENLSKINHHGDRASSIVRGMLAHSRTSAGEKTATDINQLCDEYVRLAYHGMRAKDNIFKVAIETDLQKNLPKINVTSQDIGRVILNLVNNAFQACHAKAKVAPKEYQPLVKIETRRITQTNEQVSRKAREAHGMDHIQITISDNGPGISEEIKDKIFQPFFTTKPTGQGTGLGLSLSYDIVKAHGGELIVNNKIGQENGSQFIITLPIILEKALNPNG